MLLITRDYGRMYINFDKMEVHGSQLKVRRQTFLSSDEKQEIVWYYNDNRRWHDLQGSFQLPPVLQTAPPGGGGWKWQFLGDEGVWTDYSSTSCSMGSDDIERWYQSNPQGQVTFTGKFRYTLDFTGMLQTNNDTGTQRPVKRIQAVGQPTYQSSLFNSLLPLATPPVMPPSLPPPADCTWEFMGDEGVWTEYQTPSCTLDSKEIERLYQLNPQGQISFTAGMNSYTLDFARMCQTNDRFGTRRAVKRTQNGSTQLNSSSGYYSSQCRWQFKDVDGTWRDYTKGHCSVSSQDIENSYQQNPNGTMNFSTGSFQYVLDFSGG
ncbi:hypothetical protein JZ751_008826 [Albula glossodonta]|uniref:WWE domain-containing protein n=1 Tax=Albula glossodonta TaxID=121402 RepID=A0A8T2P7U0_9TELE|nr:hypothetical protein JZ751_008826 [Albula glossodonta]